ncbi:hypothetical protein [Marixanthomonas spongiae]|nr:hypothetical protein [Marixanthomonas spongiae]
MKNSQFTKETFNLHKDLFNDSYGDGDYGILSTIAEKIRNCEEVIKLFKSLENKYFPEYEDVIDTAIKIKTIEELINTKNPNYFDLKKRNDYLVATCMRILEEWAYNYLPIQEQNPNYKNSDLNNEELGWYIARKEFEKVLFFSVQLEKNNINLFIDNPLRKLEEEKNYGNSTSRGIEYLTKLSITKREHLLSLLRKINEIQKMELGTKEKAERIKIILWTNQNTKSKLLIGGFIGTMAGLFIFGTGGIGIAGLGGAVGIWGFLAGTSGGVFIASLIENFEKKNE